MGATWLMARSALRGRRRAHLALATLLVVGLGTALAAFTVAWRTDHEYPDYLRRADVGQLVVNPGLITDHLLDVIRTTPGVASASTSRLFNAVPPEDVGRTVADVAGDSTQVLGSTDGRYLDVDRPVVVAGRMISSVDEVFVDRGAARQYGLHVGDALPLSFVAARPSDAPPDQVLTAIGTERPKVVGIGVFADEVLHDDLYGTSRILLSRDLAAKYSCIAKQPAADDPRSIDQMVPDFFPQDCSTDVALISLRLTDGDAGVPAVLSALDARITAENSRLPAAMQQNDFTFFITPTVTSVQSERIRRSLEPVVTALRLLGIAMLVATVVLAATAMYRITRSTELEALIWNQLGVDRARRMAAIVAPTAIAIAGAVGLALLAGWLASGIGPVASVGVLDPSPPLGIPAVVIVAVIPGVIVTGFAALAFSAWSTTSTAARRASTSRSSWLADAAVRTGDVPLALGVHAAIRGRSRTGSAALLAATVVGFAVVTAALVYSTNLMTLVTQPSRFGWPYDAGVVVNFGYDGADQTAIAASLNRPEVASYGIASTFVAATIGDLKLPTIGDIHGFADVGLPMIAGVMPRHDHEVALGSMSAKRLGVSVGAAVHVVTDYGERDATVTGIAVMPAIGPFLADPAGLGTGIVLSAPMLAAVIAHGEAAAGVAAGTFSSTAGGFVAIDVRAGANTAQLMRDLDDQLVTWDIHGTKPMIHISPVLPAQIADIESVRGAPLLLAGLIAVTMCIGLATTLSRAIRVRRRELAVLRAIGCRGRQLYSTLCWQSVTVVFCGLVIGVPLGAILGSTLWRRFASGLGIVPTPRLPFVWIGLLLAVSLAVAVAVALLPGRRASATHPAAELRNG